jgi:transposase
MAPHLSDDLRNRIVHWHVELKLSPKEIAALAGCSIQTAQMILRRGMYSISWMLWNNNRVVR